MPLTDDEYRAKTISLADLIGDLTDVDVTVDDRAEVKRALDGGGVWVQVWVWVSE